MFGNNPIQIENGILSFLNHFKLIESYDFKMI